MWILLAFASALFAGLTNILAKVGIKNTDSSLATAVRTIVVLAFSWLMVLLVGLQKGIDTVSLNTIDKKAWIFLILSGLATGASWLSLFKALQIGDVNRVVPVDKSSIILTVIFAFVILGEKVTWIKVLALTAIGIGTFMMIEKRKDESEAAKKEKGKSCLFFAFLSAIFAALVSILGKIGMQGINSQLGTAVRTVVVLIMAWLVVMVKGKLGEVKHIGKKDLVFIILSGFATGGSWICYYQALQDGPASAVVPIDKLSIVVSIAFSYFILKEKITKMALAGLVLIVGGTLAMLI
ncbi:MAG TPA: EamA family transporter [Clostridiales bacterium]|nr:EamA family transporter [Clostridiales bacterium]